MDKSTVFWSCALPTTSPQYWYYQRQSLAVWWRRQHAWSGDPRRLLWAWYAVTCLDRNYNWPDKTTRTFLFFFICNFWSAACTTWWWVTVNIINIYRWHRHSDSKRKNSRWYLDNGSSITDMEEVYILSASQSRLSYRLTWSKQECCYHWWSKF